MAKLVCVQAKRMPVNPGEELPLEYYEDYYGDDRDVYDVPDDRVDEFLATGCFKKA